MKGRRARTALPAAAALGATALLAGAARAEPPAALRVDYEGHEGCPGAPEFLRDVLARTSRARAAVQSEGLGEPALEVWVRIARRDDSPRAGSLGRIVLWKSTAPRAREVSGESCAEVAEALALITALAIDPSASTGKSAALLGNGAPTAVAPGSVAVSPGPNVPVQPGANVPVPPGSGAPPGSVPWGLPASTEWTPPPWRGPVPAPAPARSWTVGAHFTAGLAGAPSPLFGGGLFAERASGDRRGVAGRLSVDLAGTGTFDAGPGAASFLRGTAGLEGCPFARLAVWLTAGGCVAGEVGFLRGQGVAKGDIDAVAEALVPWAALGLRARLAVDLGASGVLTLDGGPMFPLVRRSFVFEAPNFTVFEVPPVIGSLRLAAGVRF